MNTKARIRKIESKVGERQDVRDMGIQLIELTPEQKLTWPNSLPYPLLGGTSQ